ncbi:MAG: glycogen/starch synthase [Sulfurimonas sp.]|uniref:glycogen synthase n=1 Tax=Sulfurimonas sp. TaxID=2022749 RepID=UPI0026373EE5|nr:glycogen/starch synthase [Sulfurimonas sp.]MDD2652252.1 glycogen/starch synthase [Sulfurimonas sp.]MDD3451579.1 glycogen/starch synthase [Sulfurimonas sp.]
MKTLFCASEIYPYAKSGGLADVGYSLVKALGRHTKVQSVMPLYGFMPKEEFEKTDISFSINLGGLFYKVSIYEAFYDGIKTYFVDVPLLSATEEMYGDAKGDYANNDIRFALFCAAVVKLAQIINADIIHANDWHSALVPLMVRRAKLKIKTLFSIHNLAYQGIFERDSLARVGLEESYFHMDALEFYGRVNFLKAGIIYSDALTTVSPTYAKEIQTKEFGCGLEGLLQLYKAKLTGILNGIDESVFNPQNDAALLSCYSSETLAKKYENKKALQMEFGLSGLKKPLFVMISRLVHQKGFDLLIESLDAFLMEDVNFVLLANGDENYKKTLLPYTKKYKNFRFLCNGYDEPLSHRIYAAGDFLLMPSLYEPCGLNQMIAARYGTIPVVHRVGGLKDSVHERGGKCAHGIVMREASKKTLIGAVKRAIMLYNNNAKKEEMISFNMNCNFSFAKSALLYHKLYKKLLS